MGGARRTGDLPEGAVDQRRLAHRVLQADAPLLGVREGTVKKSPRVLLVVGEVDHLERGQRGGVDDLQKPDRSHVMRARALPPRRASGREMCGDGAAGWGRQRHMVCALYKDADGEAAVERTSTAA